MPRFPDATGYLLEMRDAINEAWFHALCDLAIASVGVAPPEEQLNHLWELFHGPTPYTPAASTVAAVAASGTVTPIAVYLEELSHFSAFKKLAPGLTVTFERQLTVIFGKNGSGKSSLCEALKVLANPERPQVPLHNVRATFPGTPTFAYRFRGQQTPTSWTLSHGFGSQATSLKYFDSTIAVKHTQGSLQPAAAIEVAPFRLEVFEYARQLTTAFQAFGTGRANQAAAALQSDINALKQRLAPVVILSTPPFDQWSATNSTSCAAYIRDLPPFDELKQARLAECLRQHGQLTSATSEDGLRSLNAQQSLLNQLAGQVTSLLDMCSACSLGNLQLAETQAAQKHAASAELARMAFPPGVNAQHQHALIAAAAVVCDFSAFRAGEYTCPLCNQRLSAEAEGLFASYHSYLSSTLQRELSSLQGILQTGRTQLHRIASFTLNDFSACRNLLPAGQYDSLVPLVDAIVRSVPSASQPLSAGNAAEYSRFSGLVQHLTAIRAAQAGFSEAINAGTRDRSAIANRLQQLEGELGALRAHQAVDAERTAIDALCNRSVQIAPYHQRINQYDFSSRLRTMTNKGKEAHHELILGAFEERLSQEYRALCGATIDQMGVRLATRGSQQEVIVTPLVGDAPVHRVLSEGEQKVHALAVFMCEAASTPQRVLVFDDPATSFDYNYVSNFCERIRNVVRDQPTTQIIVLTHNWDFFINLQTTINRTRGLDGRMSVQVLEDCATVREYTESWEELCSELTPLLAGPAEPSGAAKEHMAGIMRRLIERLTNKHVFNEQRHQYKPKTLHSSEFHHYTKLVPLLASEADTLRDLFANLSPPEHDDPRNFYTSRSRSQFNTWYDQIQAIKTALEARRP